VLIVCFGFGSVFPVSQVAAIEGEIKANFKARAKAGGGGRDGSGSGSGSGNGGSDKGGGDKGGGDKSGGDKGGGIKEPEVAAMGKQETDEVIRMYCVCVSVDVCA
jgi:hypothetical protein